MTATNAALVIYPDGDVIEIPLGDDSLKTMCAAIGCSLVDVVRLTSRIDMWIDDEGLYNHPVNPAATALARHYGFVWQPYHGPVVLTSVDRDGNTLELTKDQLVALLTRLLDAADVL